MDSVELGSKVRHTITGYDGIVIARTEWLNGCWRITVQAQQLHDGKPVTAQVFDIEELELIEEVKREPVKRSGGGRPNTGQRR